MLMLRAGGAEAVRSWGPARMLSRGCFPRRTAMTVASSMRNGDAQTNPLLAPLVQREVVPQALSTASPSTSGPTSSVAACTLLVAGTAVGAGMLALPTVTAPVGFAAAGPTLVGACVYSLITGLLVAEVTINTLQRQQQDGDSSPKKISLTSMALSTLGSAGTPLVVLPYLFLHFSLLVAYIAKAGEVISTWTELPLPMASVLFTALFGGACYVLPTRLLDNVNGLLVLGSIASFFGLFGLALTDVDPAKLEMANWTELLPTLPVIALAFVFQNIVPVVVQRLDCDRGKVRLSIFLGMGISLAMFLLWDGAILASSTSEVGASDPLSGLRAASPIAGPLINVFTFLLVSSSFVCFVLSVTDFLADTFRLGERKDRLDAAESQQAASGGTLPRPVLYGAALLPPMALALLNPTIFFNALEYAGSYGVMTLFGVMPAAMAWKQRYGNAGSLVDVQMVPGGRFMLATVAVAAAGIIANQANTHVKQIIDHLYSSS